MAHWQRPIDLWVDDESYGSFYLPEMGRYIENYLDDHDEPEAFDEMSELEYSTALRLSALWNMTQDIPTAVLLDKDFRFKVVARAWEEYKNFIEEKK